MVQDSTPNFTTERRSTTRNNQLNWGGDGGEPWGEAIDISSGIKILDDPEEQAITVSQSDFEGFEDGTTEFAEIAEWVDWTGDTDLIGTTTDAITGNYSLSVDQSTSMTAQAAFSKSPTRIKYESYWEWSSGGWGDSSNDQFLDGNGNRIVRVQYRQQGDDIRVVTGEGGTTYVTNPSNGITRTVELWIDWDAETVTVEIDGNRVVTDEAFVSTASAGEFIWQFRADADRWEFYRKYDDVELVWPVV